MSLIWTVLIVQELKKRGKQPAEFREHGTHSADFQQLCALAQELRGH